MAQAMSHQHDDVDDIKPAVGEITEVQGDSHFYETVTAAPLSPWSKTSVQLYLILLVAALNATTSGFDGVSPTSPQCFQLVTDTANSRSSAPSTQWTNTKSTSTTQSWGQARECESRNLVYLDGDTELRPSPSDNCCRIFMIYTIGNMVGSLFTGPICDWAGRRAGMGIGSVLIMVGAAVQTAAKNDGYLLGGRFVLGFGVSIGTSAAPTYALELAPPQWRARVVGYYNTCESHSRCKDSSSLLTILKSSTPVPYSQQALHTPATRPKASWPSASHWPCSSSHHYSSSQGASSSQNPPDG